MSLEASIAKWQSLHENPLGAPKYPQERAVRWLFRNFPRSTAGACRLLDLGCGTGRHAMVFAREGYEVHALDSSFPGLRSLRRWAGEEKLTIPLAACSADRLPYSDGTFDGVLCYGVLYYMPMKNFSAAVDEIHRVLKPGGRAFVMTKSDSDSRRAHALGVSDCEYRIERLADEAPSQFEIGMTLTLLDREKITFTFRGFDTVEVDRATETSAGGLFVDDDWLVYARK